jgi:tetratricopeptide (TPR) repeat protein
MKKLFLLISIISFFACSQKTNDYKELYQLALTETDNGNFDEAIDYLDQVIKIKPEFDSAYAERAYNYLSIDEAELALKDADKAISYNYNNTCALYYRGMINNYLYKADEAIKDFTHIIRLRDSVYMNIALQERAYVYYNSDQFKKAIEDFNRMLKTDSLNESIYTSRGIAKSRDNVYSLYSDSTTSESFLKYYKVLFSNNSTIILNTKGAIDDYTKAIEINPKYDFAYYNRAKTYDDLNLVEKALTDINTAINIEESSEHYLTRALIYKHNNDTEKSLNDFNKSIEINPENEVAYLNRGYLKREQLNDKEGSIKDLEKAKELGLSFD